MATIRQVVIFLVLIAIKDWVYHFTGHDIMYT